MDLDFYGSTDLGFLRECFFWRLGGGRAPPLLFGYATAHGSVKKCGKEGWREGGVKTSERRCPTTATRD
jgi:hypothetical protein